MTGTRAPSAPPILAGFRFQELLGSGGFADVFLYEQDLPKRRVAIKVLLADQLRPGSVAEFTAEANVMALLSTHPSIVTIYQAGVSDDGRPYLVMEYCPKANLQVRYRRERFAVGEALRVGIQVAGAVETSHRAGILHRDIKPANILVTEYNRPSLTDFGISATTTGGEEAPVGMSIPWSPPESFASPARSGAQSDVYALAATIYTLLAGRSPFQLPGASNSSADVISRIATHPVPSLGREDVPTSLEMALARAMNKRPEDRFASALEFARVLQKVQIELAMSVTPVDVLDDSADLPDDRDDDDGLTRVRSVVSIDPERAHSAASAARHPVIQPPLSGASTVEAAVISALPQLDATARRGASSLPLAESLPGEFARTPLPGRPPLDETLRRVGSPETGDDHVAPRTRRRIVPIIAGVTVALVAGAVAVAMAVGNPAGTGAAQPSEEPAGPVDAVGQSTVPAPTDLVGTVGPTGVVFTWTNPDPQSGDLYLWRTVAAGQENSLATVADATVTVPAAATGPSCVEVSIRRGDGRATAAPTTACAP